MLALASLLERLREDPGTVGKRYQLAVSLDPERLPRGARIPGVDAVGERYSVDAADSFRLGEPMRLVAYPGDHTEFEDPPLAEGRRIRGPNEVEVGRRDGRRARPAARLGARGADPRRRRGALPRRGHRARARERRADRVGAARTGCSTRGRTSTPQVVVRAEARRGPRAGDAQARRARRARCSRVGAAQTDNAAFLAVLAAVLRGVGLAVGLVCLYALVQALTVTARERRGAVALLRAVGADGPTVGLVLAGAAVAVAVPAAIAGHRARGRRLRPARRAARGGLRRRCRSRPRSGQIALVTGGLLALAAIATALVARRVLREPVVAGLREE